MTQQSSRSNSSQKTSSKRVYEALLQAQIQLEAAELRKNEAIAIIGMDCSFPGGVNNPESFWQLLASGTDAIREIPQDRWDVSHYYDSNPETIGKMYTRHGGFIDEVYNFDPQFFGISPREAISMDPQQRLLLQVAWRALENAGQVPDDFQRCSTGVYMGICFDDYSRMSINSGNPDLIDAYSSLGNTRSIAVGRLAYALGLQGPTMHLDTTCSSSLLAIHLAAHSLRSQECDMALAGGVNLMLSPENFIGFSKLKALSPDGRCKTFDASANGYARGEGCGVVVLKRLSKAIADDDNIHAVIRGSAVNHDGKSNGLTAPNGSAQEAVIRQALENAGLKTNQIQYIETHGTGTSLGDPIEILALGKVFGQELEFERSKDPLYIGSVKTNFGHLESAAGMASLIKVILALQHKVIPPHLHFNEPSPHIPWQKLPVKVPIESVSWPAPQNSPNQTEVEPRRAGISAFGMSGTNVHLIVEEFSSPPKNDENLNLPWNILTLSARNEANLLELSKNYQEFIASKPNVSLADICFSAATGRSHFEDRLAIVAQSTEQLNLKLNSYISQGITNTINKGQLIGNTQPKVAFLFTGQGSQYLNMGRQLFETEPVFRSSIENCNRILSSYLETPLLDVLYSKTENTSEINRTAYTQPALFAVEYALAMLWQSWGIEPSAVMGHSLGEYVAACIAGVFNLEDGLKLITTRSRLMEELPQLGKMVVVFCSAAQISKFIEPFSEKVVIAAINGLDNIVISGFESAINLVKDKLKKEGIKTREINVSQAFHSPLMQPMIAEFKSVAETITYSAPKIDLISNVTGSLINEQIANADYWCRHILQSVEFLAGMRTLIEQDCEIFLEIGPNPILLGMGKRCLTEGKRTFLPSLRQDKDDWQQMLRSLAELYTCGITIDWLRFNQNRTARKIPLPAYPFKGEKYILTKNSQKILSDSHSDLLHPLIGKRLYLAGLENQIRFECQLNAKNPVYLTHHRIFGQPVLPATAYFEMALAAGATVLKSTNLILEDVSIRQALILSEDKARTIQVVLTALDNEVYSFEILSRETDLAMENLAWVLHTSGKVFCDCQVNEPNLLNCENLPETYSAEMNVSEFYQKLQERGMNYGETFQAVSKLWKESSQALGLIELDQSLQPGLPDYNLHPAMLDASCHPIASIAFDRNANTDAYLPIALKRLRFYGSSSSSAWWSQVKLSSSGNNSDHLLTMDATLYDPDGTKIAQIEGFANKRTKRQALLNIVQRQEKETIKDCLYQLKWQPILAKTNIDSQADQDAKSGHYLIFVDSMGVGSSLVKQLKHQGHHCSLVYSGNSFKNNQSDIYYLNPSQADEFELLSQSLALNKSQPLTKIIYLWSLDAPGSDKLTVETLRNSQQKGCGGILHLLKALLKFHKSISPKLFLVTRGTQATGQEDSSLINVAQGTVWGLGRVIALEHPQWLTSMVDLNPQVSVDEVGMLLEQIQASGENQIALRQGEIYVPRLEKHLHVKTKSFTLHSDCTYLITGGLGSLGLKVAQRLVEQGARYIVLVGRSQPSANAKSLIANWEKLGVEVFLAQSDVSHEGDMSKMFTKIGESMPPLKGVIHGAGISGIQTIADMELSQLEAMLYPKVLGAWILHQLTQNLDLDFFIEFSSIAGVWGSKGQGHYAAANHFLDGLAHYRQGKNLPASSINWGPWGGGGMASEEAKEILAQMGLESFSPERGLAILEYVMQSSYTQITAAKVDWSLFKKLYEANGKGFLLQNINVDQQKSQSQLLNGKAKILLKIQDSTPGDRQKILVAYLKDCIASLLGFDLAQVELNKPLNRMGLDSLMAVELRNQIINDTEVDIPMVRFMEDLSINNLEAEINMQLENHSSGATKTRHDLAKPVSIKKKVVLSNGFDSSHKKITPEKAADTLTSIYQLTDDEINILLKSVLEEESN